jgi:hypothetical protein
MGWRVAKQPTQCRKQQKTRDAKSNEERVSFMSDWDKVKQYVDEHQYTPKHITPSEYIATILLHIDGCSENEGREITVDEFLETFDAYGKFSDYDYN